MNTADVTHMIDKLSLASSADDFAKARDSLAVLIEFAKDAKARVDALMLESIIENERDITIGETRWYAGNKSTTKCIDAANTLNAMLGITDVEQIGKCLSTNAWKYAACRDVLGDIYADHFATSEETELREGKPVKRLQSVNTRIFK